MWSLWEMMNFPLVIAMAATAQFSQKVDSCGFANDRFNYDFIFVESPASHY
jgi:hypothetical protein